MPRLTKQKLIILQELRSLCTHPTAYELYAIVKRRLPRISLGTVYRNLELLSTQGKILKLETGTGVNRYDGTIDIHYHIRCKFCQRIEDLPVEFIHGLKLKYDKVQGFTDLGVHFEITGICPECQKKAQLQGENSTTTDCQALKQHTER